LQVHMRVRNILTKIPRAKKLKEFLSIGTTFGLYLSFRYIVPLKGTLARDFFSFELVQNLSELLIKHKLFSIFGNLPRYSHFRSLREFSAYKQYVLSAYGIYIPHIISTLTF
jgi:hypothetical protein